MVWLLTFSAGVLRQAAFELDVGRGDPDAVVLPAPTVYEPRETTCLPGERGSRGCNATARAEAVEVAAARVYYQQGEAGDREPADVAITWIRHGLACHNTDEKYWPDDWAGLAAQQRVKASRLLPYAAVDPPLTDCGVQRSAEQAHFLDPESYDWVGASALLRAIQTAALHFPAARVHVMPFVSESGGADHANWQAANPTEVLRTYAGARYGSARNATLLDRVDFSLLSVKTTERRAQQYIKGSAEFESFEPSMADALTLLVENVIPAKPRPTTLGNGLRFLKPTGTLKLAVVSHSIFLASELPDACKKALNQQHRSTRDRRKPRNNEALTVTYRYRRTSGQGHGHKALVPLSCQMAHEGFENPAALCARDVESCVGSVAPLEPETCELNPCIPRPGA